ncbi:cell wall-binding repeat-containing protein [Desulfosporosinus burensis]
MILGTDGKEGMLNFTNLTQVNGISDIVSVSAGFSHSLALKEDGTVWGWGSNELLQLGNTEQQWFDAPVQIPSLKDVTSVSAGAYLTMALKKDGTIWTLGANGSGQLGNGYQVSDLPISAAPVKVVNVTKANSNDESRTVVRYWGMDQYETSIAIAKGLRADINTVMIAAGENFPDALAGSALAAHTDSPIILVDKHLNKASVLNFLADNSGQIRETYLLGGSAVISDTSFNYLSNYLAR